MTDYIIKGMVLKKINRTEFKFISFTFVTFCYNDIINDNIKGLTIKKQN